MNINSHHILPLHRDRSLRIVSTDLYVVFLYKDTEKIKICLNCYVDKVIVINTICDSVIHLVARMIQKINPKQER